MAKRKSTNKKQSPLVTLVGALVVIIVFIIYLTTGVDLSGGIFSDGSGPRPTIVPQGNAQSISVPLGYGAALDFWEVYFTNPANASRDRNTWRNGIDTQLVNDIDNVQRTLDIAAFEFNNEVITEAVINARNRGVQVRVVTDNEHGLDDFDSTLLQLEIADIPIVADDRSALMHNKFMIMDGITVWTGSWNYTMNGTYRNNNNALVLRSRRAVETYQRQFNVMFNDGLFGPNKPANTSASFTQNGRPIRVLFAPEDNVIDAIIDEVQRAQHSIHFMVFSFTRDDLGAAMLAKHQAGVTVKGVFETTGSETEFSEMPMLLCAGADVWRDGNPGILHHKAIIIDDQVVITGSFNFSDNATESNDENLIIIQDPDLASEYLREYQRVEQIATRPDIRC